MEPKSDSRITTEEREIIRALVARRKKLGINVNELEAISGVHRNTIMTTETFKHPPHLGTLIKLTRALGLAIEIQELTGDNAKAVRTLVHPLILKRLEKLAAKGLHGVGVEGVAQRMIEDGVRTAEDQGWLR